MKPVIIAGTGTSAYLAVALFHKLLPNDIIWYKPDIANIGVGEGTVPFVMYTLRSLGITDNIIFNELNGSVKLGVKFYDFAYDGHEYKHPFFMSPETQFVINDLIKTDSILSDYSMMYAVHFDLDKVYNYFDEQFQTYERLTIKQELYDYNPEETKDSYVIDLTGHYRSILKKMPDYEFQSIKNVIPNDRAYVYRREYTNVEKQKKPYTTAIAKNHGWIWNIPLGDKIGVGYVHSSKYDVLEEYIDYLREFHNDTSISKDDVRLVKFEAGRGNKSAFEHETNTICALGLSDSFIEPMEATSIGITCLNIQSLVNVISGKRTVEEHNKYSASIYDDTVNFILYHYTLSQRPGEYWQFYRDIPEHAYKISKCALWSDASYNIIINGMKGLEMPWDHTDCDMTKYEHLKVPYHSFNPRV